MFWCQAEHGAHVKLRSRSARKFNKKTSSSSTEYTDRMQGCSLQVILGLQVLDSPQMENVEKPTSCENKVPVIT